MKNFFSMEVEDEDRGSRGQSALIFMISPHALTYRSNENILFSAPSGWLSQLRFERQTN